MNRAKAVSLSIAVAMLLVSLYLVWYRGGYLAWIGVALSAVLVLKVLFFSNSFDLFLVPLIAGVWCFSWAVVFYLVVSGWESGPVSVLNIPVADDTQYTRVWLVELDGDPAAFYQTSERIIAALESSPIINIQSDGVASAWQVDIVRYDDISPTTMQQLNASYFEKYGELNNWTTVFGIWLGSVRSRETVLLVFRPS